LIRIWIAWLAYTFDTRCICLQLYAQLIIIYGNHFSSILCLPFPYPLLINEKDYVPLYQDHQSSAWYGRNSRCTITGNILWKYWNLIRPKNDDTLRPWYIKVGTKLQLYFAYKWHLRFAKITFNLYLTRRHIQEAHSRKKIIMRQ